MGKFGNRAYPKFMSKEETYGINPHTQETRLDEKSPVEIVSLGDHGDDHAMIVIKTESGEELELKFDYDGEGQLVAHHGDHEYVIPVEVEVISGEHEEEHEDEHEEHHGAMPTFESFVNECWSPMTECYNPAMSEEAKRAIKTICEEILIKEAQMCDEDHDPMHTYENYLNECGQYMTECMMEAAANIPVE